MAQKKKPAAIAKKRSTRAIAAAPVLAPLEPDARPILVVPPDTGGLNLRDASGVEILRTLVDGTFLCGRERADAILPKIGVAGQWVPVCTLDGLVGIVSAQFVRFLVAPTPPPPSVSVAIPPEVIAQRTLITTSDAQFDTPSGPWRVTAGTPVQVLESGDWPAKLDQPNQFIQIRTHALKTGALPGNMLRAPVQADTRKPVEDAPLAKGLSAWLYGIHDAHKHSLYSGGKQGWALFTSLVGDSVIPPYADWANAGFGVISRLNNDYGGSGTVPTPDQYDAFAQRCATWVNNNKACFIWIIGNEMNNKREWPDNGNNPAKEINPERYADCFNRVRRAIKAVQPGAWVIPGAIDPYQGPQISCLDWFTRMLNNIEDLDGLALHCYTHGPEAALVTDLGLFGGDPLRWQYFNFRSYTTLMDCIPARWRSKPVLITETNATPHNGQPAWAGDKNGWVQAAYSEINRWNQQPHAQQILALILYRWIRGGGEDAQYSIAEKSGVQADFRETVAGTDFRWRG